MNRKRIASLVCCLSVAGWLPIPAHAATLQLTPTDLPDVVPGHDRWRFDYVAQIAPAGLDAFAGLEVVFDPALYAALDIAAAPPAPQWLLAPLIQPDPTAPAEGLASLSAAEPIAPGASVSFSITLDRLGRGPVPAQTFYEFDAGFVRTGEATASVVPEPSSWMLMALGLAVAARRRR